MGYDVHTVSLVTGSANNRLDRMISFYSNAIASSAGGSAGGSVTVAVTFSGAELPSTYTAVATPSVNATAAITSKTNTGFNVVLTPVVATTTLAAGTFDVIVLS